MRSGEPILSLAPLEVGALALEPESYVATWRGQPLLLTPTEYRLLHALASRPGKVRSRDHLLDALADDGERLDRSIDAFVKRLRRKLGTAAGERGPIETIYGLGYRWRGEP